MSIGVDPKCTELAEHFLDPADTGAIDRLAEMLQQTVEDFFGSLAEMRQQTVEDFFDSLAEGDSR